MFYLDKDLVDQMIMVFIAKLIVEHKIIKMYYKSAVSQ